MVRRLEMYGDAALLSFPLALAAILGLSALRLETQGWAVPSVAAIAAALAIWMSRVLHHAGAEVLPGRADERRLVEVVGLGVLVLVATWVVGVVAGPEHADMIASACVFFAGLALFADAVADTLTNHVHLLMDAVRVLLVVAFQAALLVTPWGEALQASHAALWVGMASYLVGVAVMACAIDLLLGHQAHAHRFPGTAAHA